MRASLERAAVGLVVLVLAACGDRGGATETAADAPQYGGTIVVANSSDLENMNSLVATDRYTQEFNRFALFLPLVRYDEQLDYVPALAERWELLGDTGVVLHLRRDVRWHDGRPTTARDVLFTFERARDPATGFPNAEYFASWTNATSPDSFTVSFAFTPHAEPLAGLPFLPIMPAHLLDTIPSQRMRQAPFNRRPVGNGPFRFVEYRANDRWVFEANPDFPEALGGRPYIDRLVWRPMPDQTAQITALQTGTADVVLAPLAEAYMRVVQEPGMRGVVRDSRQYAAVMWNGRGAPLNDPRVRRGLTLAIDREQIIRTLRGGHGKVAAGPIAPFHWAHDEAVEPLPFAPDSARALFAAAGLRDHNADGVLELANGRPFELELKLPANSPINRDMAELIRNDLAQVGVRVVARPLDFATIVQDLTGAARNFQGAIMAWESDFRINLRDLFHSGALNGPYQIAGYSNPRVDSLLDAAARAHERSEAEPLYAELQRILRDEQPWTFLYYYPDLVLMRDRVRGAHMDIRGALLDVQRWWVTDARAVQPGGDSAARSHGPEPARTQ